MVIGRSHIGRCELGTTGAPVWSAGSSDVVALAMGSRFSLRGRQRIVQGRKSRDRDCASGAVLSFILLIMLEANVASNSSKHYEACKYRSIHKRGSKRLREVRE